MTPPEALLDDLRAAGLTVRAAAGKVLASPPSRLTPSLRHGLRLYREQLLALLAAEAAPQARPARAQLPGLAPVAGVDGEPRREGPRRPTADEAERFARWLRDVWLGVVYCDREYAAAPLEERRQVPYPGGLTAWTRLAAVLLEAGCRPPESVAR